MKGKIRLFLLLLALLCSAAGTASAEQFHQKFDDGNTWIAMQASDRSIRLAYVRGVIEGIKFCRKDGTSWSSATEDYGEYVKLLSYFYFNPDVRSIPMVIMLDLINDKIGGLSLDEEKARLKNLQKKAEAGFWNDGPED